MIKNDLYSDITRRITRVRKQGEPPKSDPLSPALDTYVCDLCRDSVGKSGLIQCPFCGRWICRNKCWNKEEDTCISCASIIKLSRESRKMMSNENVSKIDRKILNKIKIPKLRKSKK